LEWPYCAIPGARAEGNLHAKQYIHFIKLILFSRKKKKGQNITWNDTEFSARSFYAFSSDYFTWYTTEPPLLTVDGFSEIYTNSEKKISFLVHTAIHSGKMACVYVNQRNKKIVTEIFNLKKKTFFFSGETAFSEISSDEQMFNEDDLIQQTMIYKDNSLGVLFSSGVLWYSVPANGTNEKIYRVHDTIQSFPDSKLLYQETVLADTPGHCYFIFFSLSDDRENLESVTAVRYDYFLQKEISSMVIGTDKANYYTCVPGAGIILTRYLEQGNAMYFEYRSLKDGEKTDSRIFSFKNYDIPQNALFSGAALTGYSCKGDFLEFYEWR